MGSTNQEPVEVLLYGLGAIGAFYGFILSRNPKVRLSVCARSNYEAVKANGLIIDSANHGGQHTYYPHKVLRSPAEAQQTYDYIVCCNKAVNTDEVLEQLRPAVDEQRTAFAIMQNGVGNDVPFRNAYKSATIISGVVWVGAYQPRPGYVEHRSSEFTELGLHPKTTNAPTATESERLNALAELFVAGGTKIDVPEHISTARWRKAIWNMAWNSITALTGCDTEYWLPSSSFSMPVTRELMLEAVAVAKATGVPGIDESLADELIEKVKGLGKLYSSMYHDKQAGRPMEIDVILGHCVSEGRRVGVKTPTLSCLYALLAAADGRMRLEKDRKDAA